MLESSLASNTQEASFFTNFRTKQCPNISVHTTDKYLIE